MTAGIGDLVGSLAAILRRISGVAAAVLPARLWPALDEHLPVTNSAIASGILTLMVGAVIGFRGFLTYATALADENTRIFLEMAARPEAEGVLDSSALTGMTGLALFGFLFLTPLGWATLYLGCSGLLRAAAATLTEGIGDPILTGIDAAVMKGVRGARKRLQRIRRERREGPEVPDRVVTGASVGIMDAELVIVASRPKGAWDQGTVVISGEKFYRVGSIVERTIAGRLRTLYPLTEHRDLEVVRRSVRYELPAVQRS